MMVRWTPTALRDLGSLHDSAAATVELSLSGLAALARHPEMGRKGRVAGTRELIVAPCIVVYRITRGAIEIVAIIHAARRWPDSF
jgi:plasmid stabilization system protein ParE